VLKGILTALRLPELRKKIIFTVAILLLYRLGAYLPVPGIPFQEMLEAYGQAAQSSGALVVLNMFSGGALSRVSLFSLGIMPYITAQIILQMLQVVIPSLASLAKEGEAGQRKLTQYTRYLTVLLSLISAIGYLFLFQNSSVYGMDFSNMGIPVLLEDFIIVFTLVAGAVLIMWLGEVITQHGIGNGMSLIIFTNIMSGLPSAFIESVQSSSNGVLITIVMVILVIATIPLIVYVERSQRRIPVQYAKRVVGRRVMGGQTTYLPIKVNAAGVVPIIFASAILYLPAQIAVFFPNVQWMQSFANAVSSGWVNWILTVILIVAFAYFYTSMVFQPTEMADNLRKQGGFIPGVRPGQATANYIKSTLDHITLPGAIFMALIAVVPSMIMAATGNTLIQTFGGTTILIMVGVAMDTLSSLESQLKMHNYDGIFK